MLERLKVHGFRTLVDTEVSFEPLTIMIGKNGVGKTTILDSLQLVGNFARGGVDRAFGPPPWSLRWQRTKGIGWVQAVRLEVQMTAEKRYCYYLSLSERNERPIVTEELLMRLTDNSPVASLGRNNQPLSGTILNPGKDVNEPEIHQVSNILKSVVSYELNPSRIELPNDPNHDYISREGFGVAGVLSHMKDLDPECFSQLENRFRRFRPETQSIDVWSSGNVFWGIRDEGQEYAFPAVHLSWGDRQLIGLLCILYTTQPGSAIAIEEIDRGFNHSRYAEGATVFCGTLIHAAAGSSATSAGSGSESWWSRV